MDCSEATEGVEVSVERRASRDWIAYSDRAGEKRSELELRERLGAENEGRQTEHTGQR